VVVGPVSDAALPWVAIPAASDADTAGKVA
jgi:hypothetical protein